MPLSATISTIISRSKSIEICDSLHDAQNASTEEELIEAGLPLAVYSYQTGIVDDALLGSDFTEATLNTYNVYTTGTYTVADPSAEVYIMKNAVVNLSLSGTTNVKINVMGGGNLNLIAGGTSYATVKLYDNAILSATINDNAMINLESKENSVSTIVMNNSSIFNLIANSKSGCTYTGNNTSYGLANLYQNATLNYILNDTALLDFKLFQQGSAINSLT